MSLPSQMPDRRPYTRRLLWVVLLCLLLVVAAGVVIVRARRERGSSNLARMPYSHSVERSWTLGEDGKWVLDVETEQWQTGGDKWPDVRQWQLSKAGNTGSVVYWYWGGGQNRTLIYSSGATELTEGAATPVFLCWDWERMLHQDGAGGKVERQADRTWRGAQVRVYRLTASDEASDTEQTFYIDAKTGLTVREEGIARLHIPGKQASTEKLERDIDHGPFDPADLFDIHALARQPKA